MNDGALEVSTSMNCNCQPLHWVYDDFTLGAPSDVSDNFGLHVQKLHLGIVIAIPPKSLSPQRLFP
jgi:hypothetical protein